MKDPEDIEKGVNFCEDIQGIMGNCFPTLIMGTSDFISKSKNPNIINGETDTMHILNSSLIVYLFSLWDNAFTHEDVLNYFTEDEKERFFAFKHLRHVSAHNIKGSRKSSKPDKDRIGDSEKFDAVMSDSNKALRGVSYEHYSVNLGNSHAALDCRDFLQSMALKLTCGRFGADSDGLVRSTNGQRVKPL